MQNYAIVQTSSVSFHARVQIFFSLLSGSNHYVCCYFASGPAFWQTEGTEMKNTKKKGPKKQLDTHTLQMKS